MFQKVLHLLQGQAFSSLLRCKSSMQGNRALLQLIISWEVLPSFTISLEKYWIYLLAVPNPGLLLPVLLSNQPRIALKVSSHQFRSEFPQEQRFISWNSARISKKILSCFNLEVILPTLLDLFYLRQTQMARLYWSGLDQIAKSKPWLVSLNV